MAQKPKRFKEGDHVTFRSVRDCTGRGGDLSYYYGGVDKQGVYTEILEYREYIGARECWAVRVAEGGYDMLESEFEEYDRITFPNPLYTVGLKVRDKSMHNRVDRVVSYPGMPIYDSGLFTDAKRGIVLEQRGWEVASNWEAIPSTEKSEVGVGDWVYVMNSSWNATQHRWFTKPLYKGGVYKVTDVDKNTSYGGAHVLQIGGSAYGSSQVRLATAAEIEENIQIESAVIKIGDYSVEDALKHAKSKYGYLITYRCLSSGMIVTGSNADVFEEKDGDIYCRRGSSISFYSKVYCKDEDWAKLVTKSVVKSKPKRPFDVGDLVRIKDTYNVKRFMNKEKPIGQTFFITEPHNDSQREVFEKWLDGDGRTYLADETNRWSINYLRDDLEKVDLNASIQTAVKPSGSISATDAITAGMKLHEEMEWAMCELGKPIGNPCLELEMPTPSYDAYKHQLEAYRISAMAHSDLRIKQKQGRITRNSQMQVLDQQTPIVLKKTNNKIKLITI